MCNTKKISLIVVHPTPHLIIEAPSTCWYFLPPLRIKSSLLQFFLSLCIRRLFNLIYVCLAYILYFHPMLLNKKYFRHPALIYYFIYYNNALCKVRIQINLENISSLSISASVSAIQRYHETPV